MKRVPLLTLAFAILSVVFFLLLIFLRIPFPPYPLMSYQDALDILTPLVLIPLYWALFRAGSSEAPRPVEEIAFSVLAAFWAAGQGMHLAANSINNLSESLARQGVIDITGTDIYRLTYFYDERLGHYLWHIGVLGLAALLIYREWRRPAGVATVGWIAILGGVLYGFTTFSILLEGETLPIGLPFVFMVTLIILIWGRGRLKGQPILAFFFAAYLLAAILFIGWGIYFRGFPPFSAVGLI